MLFNLACLRVAGRLAPGRGKLGKVFRYVMHLKSLKFAVAKQKG